MAFGKAAAQITTTGTQIHTVSAGKEVLAHALFISNVGTVEGKVTIEVYDAVTMAWYKIGRNISVQPETTLTVEKPINMLEGDILRLTANQDLLLEVYASLLINDVVV